MIEEKVVLIVDDEPSLLEMYSERLRTEGAIVLEARDGEEALMRARENHPHVILLDIMLPKLNGIEVLRNLKNDPDTADIPVLVLSALENDARKEEALKIGAIDCLVKSDVLPVDVIEKIRKIVSADNIALGF